MAQHSRDPAYQQTLIYGAFIETVLHQMALAIFDTLGVPVWGREYDAADRLAALIMTQFGEDVMRTTIESTTQIFQWSDKTWTGRDFASVASPDAQRFYNYLCIAYAASPYDYGYLVRGGTLPSERADRCDGEYQQIKKAFNLRIMPYVDPDLLVKARARRWSVSPPRRQRLVARSAHASASIPQSSATGHVMTSILKLSKLAIAAALGFVVARLSGGRAGRAGVQQQQDRRRSRRMRATAATGPRRSTPSRPTTSGSRWPSSAVRSGCR